MRFIAGMFYGLTLTVSWACASSEVVQQIKTEEYLGHALIADLQIGIQRYVSDCKQLPYLKYGLKPLNEDHGSIEYECSDGMRMIQFTFSEWGGIKALDSIRYGYGPKGMKPFTRSEAESLSQEFFSKVRVAYQLACPEKPDRSDKHEESFPCRSAIPKLKGKLVRVGVRKIIMKDEKPFNTSVDIRIRIGAD